MTSQLAGQSAVITGSTSGIGLGLARHLAGCGVNIMLNGFGDADEIETIRAGLDSDHGIKAHYNDADMTDAAAIAGLIAAAEDAFGAVDILINNAGIQHVSPIEDFPPEKWDAIIAINLSSCFHAIRAALPGMRRRGRGRIVNIASAHGLVASPYKAAYVAAKHGVVGLTKTVGLETAEDENITCNAICPGYVRTPLVDNQIRDQAKAHNMSESRVIREVILAAQPRKRFVTLEELGALTEFLCGDAALSFNGAALPVEGGWTAR